MEAKITIRNKRTQKEETIDKALWDKKKAAYQNTFTVVGEIKEPPEVKDLKVKQAEKPAPGGAEKPA